MAAMKKGTEYFRVHWPDGTPSALYFRITITDTGLNPERWDREKKAWVLDSEVLDYWWGFEPGAEPIPADQAPGS
jgi:hypothetical protein